MDIFPSLSLFFLLILAVGSSSSQSANETEPAALEVTEKVPDAAQEVTAVNSGPAPEAALAAAPQAAVPDSATPAPDPTTRQPTEEPTASKVKNAHTILKSLTGETILKNIQGFLPKGSGGGDINGTDLETLVKSGQGIIHEMGTKLLKGLGQKCSGASECLMQFTECKEGQCACRQNYMPSTDNVSCLQIAQDLGDDCRENIQCKKGLETKFGNTMCVNFKCTCALQHKLTNGKCVADHAIGTVCVVDEDCSHAKDAKCIQGVCACSPGWVPAPEEDRCLAVAKSVQDGCQEDGQCTAQLYNSICQNSKCVCREFNVEVDGKCQPIKALGDDCTKNRECERPEEEAAYSKTQVKRGCVDNKCACISGKRDKDVCTSLAGRFSADGWSALMALIVAVFVSRIIVN